jgi:hypothetical protein
VSRHGRVALWLNAFNTMVLAGIAGRFCVGCMPPASAYVALAPTWDLRATVVARKLVSLADVEAVLRSLGDDRVFAGTACPFASQLSLAYPWLPTKPSVTLG